MSEPQSISRPWPDAPWFAISGWATGYRVEPNGEIVLGYVRAGAMSVRRGRQQISFGPASACVWDGTDVHAGVPAGCKQWHARVIVLEPSAVEDQLRDLELVPVGATFPQPHIENPALVATLVAVHRSVRSADRLAQQALLAECIAGLVESAGILRAAKEQQSCASARRDRSLARACEYLREHPARNVSLDELAAAASTTRFRLVRLFRAAFGLPPHRYQLGQRIALARRLLERGDAPSEVAVATGFVDQAHLHRHFVRTLGITPHRYARAV